ncbi:MAG: DedA family protein [Alistipes sp.]|jgi:membrane protein YqaA with SNARE-associated domain|nr:DedA family protein [Alistipes sp.]
MTTESIAIEKRNPIRRLYDWVLGWSDSRWGEAALFVLAFAESSFFPVPPDVLLIALCLGRPKRALRYALICTAGSVTGALGGYAIGYFLWQTTAGDYTGLAHWCFAHIFPLDSFLEVQRMFEQYNFWAIFTAGFTPIPFKLFTIAGGVFHIGVPMFFLASVVSRGLRFFLIAWLIRRFGPPIRIFIDRYFNALALAFTVVLIGAFVLVKFLL